MSQQSVTHCFSVVAVAVAVVVVRVVMRWLAAGSPIVTPSSSQPEMRGAGDLLQCCWWILLAQEQLSVTCRRRVGIN